MLGGNWQEGGVEDHFNEGYSSLNDQWIGGVACPPSGVDTNGLMLGGGHDYVAGSP